MSGVRTIKVRQKPSSSILGIVIAFAILWLSVMSTTENQMMYLNALALMLVVGGTLAAAILTFSLSEAERFAHTFIRAFMKPVISRTDAINEVLSLAAGYRADPDHFRKALGGIKHPFTREVVQLIIEGLPLEEVRAIMRQMVAEEFERELSDATLFRVVSKYPPAFGLMGTLIGLIAMLQSMGSGVDMLNNLGPHMSVALIATFYGIMTANMFLIPIAESAEKSADRDSKTRQIVASGVLMVVEKTPVILIRERLKGYLAPTDKAKVITPTSRGGTARSAEGPRIVAGGNS
jgi:chemotaxis protein MotA